MIPRDHTRLDRFYSIGEVAKMTGVRPNIIRYWEQEFKELKPLRRKKGAHRLYGDREVAVVKSIQHLLREEGLSIPGARKRLSEPRQEELPFTRTTIGVREMLKGLKRELDDLEILLSNGSREMDRLELDFPKGM